MMRLDELRSILSKGLAIPAHPLALDASRKLDERRQRALTRYYLAAGAGGLAVGVHTTQFEIHDPAVGLYLPVLELAMEECRALESAAHRPVKVAGVIGQTKQAVDEASLARSLGYDCGLLGLGALKDASEDELIAHVEAVAEVIPLFGFYLQPAVGGRLLPYSFWRRFAEIEQVVAIKIAPFNRYYTLDVVRAVADSGRLDEIALYTGNDDNIIADLITPFRFESGGEEVTARIVGGLLGHWAFWTQTSVALLERAKASWKGSGVNQQELLALNVQTTDANAAAFDTANQFQGCIAGIHEILRRQGLLEGIWCLNPEETLSPGQSEEIDRVTRAYPHLTDDNFVAEHLDNWLKP
ncbi:MAG: dihydrodipicolinate synthase family protein [Acidobacteriota bacterium]|nr:MAG: dihydrodipicolinate synthase family protein [Acidobacteriota bacterium]